MKIFTSVYTFQRAKNIFFPKLTQIWSSTRKKIKKEFVIFFHNRGGEGGGQTRDDKCHLFFLMKASLIHMHVVTFDALFLLKQSGRRGEEKTRGGEREI